MRRWPVRPRCYRSAFNAAPFLFRNRRDGVLAAVAAALVGFQVAAGHPGGQALARSCAAVLHTRSFAAASTGAQPDSSLIQVGSSIYGTTAGQQGADLGGHNITPSTIFRLSRDGTLTALHAFTELDSFGDYLTHPMTGLVRARGALYGTTYGQAGNNVVGPSTIFRMTPAGDLTTVYAFRPVAVDGPDTDLAAGPDGALYGTTDSMIFELTQGDHLVSRHTFAARGHHGPLRRGHGGLFYGAAPGSLYSITPSGMYRTLHSLGPIGGESPAETARLIQDSHGNIYGETSGAFTDNGQEALKGTVYRLSPSGHMTILHSFSATHARDGYFPMGGLAWGHDEDLYGVTEFGGTSSSGTIFRLTTAGQFTTLHSFGGTGRNDGAFPLAGLTMARDGTFYGTASGGGASFNGTIFWFTPPSRGCH